LLFRWFQKPAIYQAHHLTYHGGRKWWAGRFEFMKKIHSEGVLLTEIARDAWIATAKQAVAALKAKGITLRPEEIPDEDFWIRDDGVTLVIKCESEKFTLAMDIPKGQWSWNAQ
jgi:agmatine/peptidylarginine deiminase